MPEETSQDQTDSVEELMGAPLVKILLQFLLGLIAMYTSSFLSLSPQPSYRNTVLPSSSLLFISLSYVCNRSDNLCVSHLFFPI